MPGKGHSGRFRSSISNRSDKPAFRVLAPWNSRKNGQKGQVAISQGSDTVKFAKLDAQQMANYNAGNSTFTMNNNFTVGANGTSNFNTVNAGDIIQQQANTTQVGTLTVLNDATYNNNLTVGQNLVVGNDFTVNGTTTTINTKIVDISDSIIKVNDVYCDQDGNKSHGILFEYNTEHETGVTGNFQPTNGFFGVQRKIGPDINTHTLGAANTGGGSGVFTYYTKDISDNVSGALLTDGSFNIPTAFLGDALFNNLDLCGNLTGYNTFQIKNGEAGNEGTIQMRANKIQLDASNIDIDVPYNGVVDINGGVVQLVANGGGGGRFSALAGNLTLEAVSTVVPDGKVDINARSDVCIDASGIVSIDAGAASNFTTSVGTLTLNGAGGVNIEGAGGSEVDITTTGLVDINAGTGVTIDADAASNFTTTAGTLTLDGATGVDISGNAGAVNITTTGTVDINAGPLDISASTVDIDATSSVSIDAVAASNFTVSGTNHDLTLENSGGGANNRVHILSAGTGTAVEIQATAGSVDVDAETSATINAKDDSNFTVTGSDKTLTLAAAGGGTNRVIVNSAGTGANAVDINATVGGVDIDAAAGQDVNIAGGQVALVSKDATASAISLTTNQGTAETIVVTNNQGQTDNAITLTAIAGGVDIDAAAAFDVDIAGGQVKLSNKEDIASAISLTTNQGTNETIVVTNTQGTDEGAIALTATAGGVDIDAAAGKDVDIAGGQVKLSNKEDIAPAISLTTNAGSNETIEVTNNQGNDLNAITMCAKAGGIIIDAFTGVRIGTETAPANCPTSAVIIGGATTSTVFNGDISANGNIDAAGQTATFDTVVTNQLNLLNNFTIGTIGSNENNFILFAAGGVIGNGIMTASLPGVSPPTQILQAAINDKHAINLREDLTWISKKDGNNSYPGFDANDPAVLKGGSLVVDGNMLFGAARGRTGIYDQGADNNVNYGTTGLNNHRLLDMNCNDMSGVRILSFSKKPIGDWKSNGQNDLTAAWGNGFDLSNCNIGLIDLACGFMVDISGLHFCDPSMSSITAGNSLDVSSNAVHFFNEGGANNILVDISGIFQVGGADNTNGPVLKVMYTQQEDGSLGAGSSSSTNGSTARIKTTHTDQNAIEFHSTDGGILNTYDNSKNFIITDDDVGAKNSLIFNGDPTPGLRTIALTNGRGTGEDAITLTSTVGGVDIDAAVGKDVDISGGQVLLGNKDPVPGAISLTTNVGAAETIVITNTQGNTEAAITLNAVVGGVDIDAAATFDVDISGGQVLLGNKDAVPGAISLTTNVDTAETIVITNNKGTDPAAITLNAVVGGVDIDAAAAKDVNIAGGQVALVSKDDAASAISLTTNQGTTETIVITNNKGTDPAAITLNAAAGGVDVDAETSVTIDANELSHFWVHGAGKDLFLASGDAGGGSGRVQVRSFDSAPNAISLTATAGGIDIDAGAAGFRVDTINGGIITIDSTSGVSIDAAAASNFTTSSGALTLDGDGGVKINTGTNKPIEINSDAGAIGSVLTSLGSSARPIWSMETTVPIGGIMMWTGAAAPTNWQICDGLTFVAADYPTLNTRLGGNTRPNMTGLFVRGFESGVTSAVGGTGGQADNKIGTTHLPSHSHTITDNGHTHTATVTPGSGHQHTVPSGINGAGSSPHPGFFAAGTADGGVVNTSSSTANPTISNSTESTGITLGNTGGGSEYTPSHYVVYYIIYAGPVGA